MDNFKDTNSVWKRPLGCFLWLLVFFLVAPILVDIFGFIVLLFID